MQNYQFLFSHHNRIYADIVWQYNSTNNWFKSSVTTNNMQTCHSHHLEVITFPGLACWRYWSLGDRPRTVENITHAWTKIGGSVPSTPLGLFVIGCAQELTHNASLVLSVAIGMEFKKCTIIVYVLAKFNETVEWNEFNQLMWFPSRIALQYEGNIQICLVNLHWS